MTHVNNITLTGVITRQPVYLPVGEDHNTSMVAFAIRDSDVLGDRRSSYTVDVKAYGGVAEYVNMNLTAGDRVLVSGVVCSRSKPVGGAFTNAMYIYGRAIVKLEQEFYE